MSQRYPAGADDRSVKDGAPPPQSVLNAVKLMYAGAVVSGISVILQFITIAAERSSFRKQHPHYTAAHIHQLVVGAVAGVTFIGVISIGLWILMARTNLAGRGWARIAASVLFALDTIFLIESVRMYGLQIGLIPDVLIWLIGLGAVMFLWRRESSDFFQPR
jgi:hypothetical protein